MITPAITPWRCSRAWNVRHARRKFVDAQKVQPKGKTGRADIALTMINKLYGIERECKDTSDDNGLSLVRKRACRSWVN
ncbi:transposase [Pseudomonas brassicacearum]|nr:transposase [Pseudomonas brassicacearum]